MKNNLKKNIFGILILGGIGLLAFNHLIPKPVSDVPVVYKISWNSYQSGLSITQLRARVLSVDPKGILGLDPAIVEFEVSGTIAGKGQWRPQIERVHISERWIQLPGESVDPVAEIVLTPLIGVKRDEKYSETPVEFKIKVQDKFATTAWGKNLYQVKAGEQKAEFEIWQSK